METVFQLQSTSIVTKELFRPRRSLYPHNIKEVDLSEKAHKVKECVGMILWLNWYMTYKKDKTFTFYIWLNPLSLSSTPTMSFEGRWPKQPDPHNSLCRTFPRLEIKVIHCHRLPTTNILIVCLFIPSSPVSFCGAPGSLRLRSSCRCLRRAPPSANHLQKYQLLQPCKSLSTHRPAPNRWSWSSLPLPGKSLPLAVSRVLLFIVVLLILGDQPVDHLGCAPLELVPVVAAHFKIELKK